MRKDFRYYRLENGMIIDTKGETGYKVLEATNCVNPTLILCHYSDKLGFIVRMGDEVGNLVNGLDLVMTGWLSCQVKRVVL